MTSVKICGLTTPETLDAALAGGAAFVGAVIFPKSPRHLDPLHAATLFERARNRAKIASSISSAASWARAIRPSSSASSVVVKRMALASVWRWMKFWRCGSSSRRVPCAAGTSTK